MDPDDFDLQQQIANSRDEPELDFSDLIFAPIGFQPPIESLPDHQHGSFDHSFGPSSAPMPIAGGYSAPTRMERVTSMSSGGQSSAGHFAGWSVTSSPPQHLNSSLHPYHPSPMLNAFTSLNDMSLAHGGASLSSNSLNDHLTSFSFGSSTCFSTGDQSEGFGSFENVQVPGQMNGHDFNAFFSSSDVAHATNVGSLLYPNEGMSLYSGPMQVTPDTSPQLLPQGNLPFTYSYDTQDTVIPVSSSDMPMALSEDTNADGQSSIDLKTPHRNKASQISLSLLSQDKSKRSKPSQDKDMSFVHMNADGSRGGRILPVQIMFGSKRTTGRKGPLEGRTRAKAGKMRILGACIHCRARKASCDDGIYCRSCIRHFGTKLIRSPCRGKVLSDLAEDLMPGGAFPTHRSLENFLPAGYKLSVKDLPVKILFGFGPSILVRARVVIPNGDIREKLEHVHQLYQWPIEAKQTTPSLQCKHDVFPAVLTDESQIRNVLEQHLTALVDQHFEQFPRYQSQLDVLPSIYRFYQNIPQSEVRTLLGLTLKLLVLVHIGGDFQMDASDANCRMIVQNIFKNGRNSTPVDSFDTCPENLGEFPLPCFIRGQFGKVMPQLALELMTDVLRRLESLSLSLKCELWAPILASFTVLLMTIESIDYHARKTGFHAGNNNGNATTPPDPIISDPFDLPAPGLSHIPEGAPSTGNTLSEQAFDYLVKFYHACFSSCHHRLSEPDSTRKRSNSAAAAIAAIGQKEAQNTLITELKSALNNASNYLAEKRSDARQTSDDLSFFFDRKLAKFFLHMSFGFSG